MSARTLFVALLASLALPSLARAQDMVELTDGTKVEGRVVYEDDKEVIVLVATKERSVPRAQVRSVRSLMDSQHEALDQWDRLKPGDADGLWELATLCRDQGLGGEAQVFAWLVVLASPEHAAAHELLGHKHRNGQWEAQDGQAWMPLERIYKARGVFHDGWQLATLHYKLQSNLPLASALTMLIDLERYDRFFFQVFGKELKLRDVVEPMAASIYADAKSFPQTSDGRPAYFSYELNTFFALEAGDLDPSLVYHEATHQLLHSTAEREAKARGNVPAWIQEGLAMYMEASGRGLGGHATFEAGTAVPSLFALHAKAKKPYDLPRMFTFQEDDFAIRSKSDLKYAQAYTLVYYCLHGEDGKLRPGFFDYLRRVYRGDSSASAFEGSIGVNEKKMERAWLAYAHAIAGH